MHTLETTYLRPAVQTLLHSSCSKEIMTHERIIHESFTEDIYEAHMKEQISNPRVRASTFITPPRMTAQHMELTENTRVKHVIHTQPKTLSTCF